MSNITNLFGNDNYMSSSSDKYTTPYRYMVCNESTKQVVFQPVSESGDSLFEKILLKFTDYEFSHYIESGDFHLLIEEFKNGKNRIANKIIGFKHDDNELFTLKQIGITDELEVEEYQSHAAVQYKVSSHEIDDIRGYFQSLNSDRKNILIRVDKNFPN